MKRVKAKEWHYNPASVLHGIRLPPDCYPIEPSHGSYDEERRARNVQAAKQEQMNIAGRRAAARLNNSVAHQRLHTWPRRQTHRSRSDSWDEIIGWIVEFRTNCGEWDAWVVLQRDGSIVEVMDARSGYSGIGRKPHYYAKELTGHASGSQFDEIRRLLARVVASQGTDYGYKPS